MGTVGGLSTSEMGDFVTMAVDNARVELWSAKPWTFRERQYSQVISSEQDAYELPDDFEAIKTSRENESLYGSAITFKSKDEFDNLVPNLSGWTSGIPQLYTVYSGTTNNKKYIQFYPRPTITPLYLNILVSAPSDVSQFPDKARAALIAVAEKYLFVPGTAQAVHAYGLAEAEIAKLEIEDSLYVESLWRFKDETDERANIYDQTNFRYWL